MPSRPARPCAQPGCDRRLTGRRWCDEHRPADPRPSAHRRGYGRRWAAKRAAYLRAHPTCELPSGCAAPATDVHHLDGRGPGGDNRWANLQALCHPHHSAATVAGDGGFGRARQERA